MGVLDSESAARPERLSKYSQMTGVPNSTYWGSPIHYLLVAVFPLKCQNRVDWSLVISPEELAGPWFQTNHRRHTNHTTVYSSASVVTRCTEPHPKGAWTEHWAENVQAQFSCSSPSATPVAIKASVQWAISTAPSTETDVLREIRTLLVHKAPTSDEHLLALFEYGWTVMVRKLHILFSKSWYSGKLSSS